VTIDAYDQYGNEIYNLIQLKAEFDIMMNGMRMPKMCKLNSNKLICWIKPIFGVGIFDVTIRLLNGEHLNGSPFTVYVLPGII